MKKTLGLCSLIASLIIGGCTRRAADENVIFRCDKYTVYTDSVVQDSFVAKAISPFKIVTNYVTSYSEGSSSALSFRLSLNSRDNELPLGQNHHMLLGSADTSKVVVFGDNSGDKEPKVGKHILPEDYRWTLKVDMRPVLRSFDKYGYYVTPTLDTIYADDFKGVWVAGSVEPLNWDFENLYGKHDRKLRDRGDSIYEVSLVVNPHKGTDSVRSEGWSVSGPNRNYPLYSSNHTLVDAIYNMGIDNITSNIRDDDTFRAGKEWDGVWTRDISYAIYLSLAYLDPYRSMNSLRAKVKNGRIVQDTGTGGAWPVSSDRIVWAVAAWEVYKVTGDKEWLREVRNVIANTIDTDLVVTWDKNHKLFHGEQSYLDWREQTYPKWMQPADIYESMCLGTNVVYFKALEILSKMDAALGSNETSQKYLDISRELRESINANLWIPNLGYYSEYLYGGIYPLQSQTTDNLGQSLSVIFNVADKEMAQSIIRNTPRMEFGTPSVFPQIRDVKPYHNDAVWPFVQSFWNIASAKAGNTSALCAGLGALYRAAAFFSTHKELFVASTGDYKGTAINSDAQLWSCAGAVAMNFRIFAGMNFEEDGIRFNPYVPEMLDGDKIIEGFRYRNAMIKIIISGTGSRVSYFSIDGVQRSTPFFSADLKGEHEIKILLTGNTDEEPVDMTQQVWAPSTPVMKWRNTRVGDIVNYSDTLSYMVYLNGIYEQTLEGRSFELYDANVTTIVNMVPISDNHYVGFASKPYVYIPAGCEKLVQIEEFVHGGSRYIKNKKIASRFVETSLTRNRDLSCSVEVETEGEYLIDVRYANGSGPINTENKCAIRMLYVNDNRVGAVVMPQRGTDEWISTGFSNMMTATLKKGSNDIRLIYEKPYCENMNGEVNTALIDYIRIIKK